MKVWTPHQASQPGGMATGLGIPRESDFEGQQDLIKYFHRTEGNRDLTFVALATQSWSTLCDPLPARFLCLWNSPSKNTGVGSHYLFLGIFPTQELNLGLLQADALLSEPPGKPSTLVGHKRILVYTRTQEKGAVSPQDTELDLPTSVGGFPLEEWVGSGLSWDMGTGNSSTERCSLAWALLEVTINSNHRACELQGWVTSSQITNMEEV